MEIEGIYGFSGDYAWLSNMWECRVRHLGLVFPSSEHAYVYSKADDKQHNMDEIYPELINLTPKESKTYGKKLILRPNWDNIKILTMRNILYNKFANKDLLEKLLATDDLHIEETNVWKDTFWGVCDGVGQNQLGKLLMAIRNDLKFKKLIK